MTDISLPAQPGEPANKWWENTGALAHPAAESFADDTEFVSGPNNPFFEFATGVKARFANLNLEGQAKVGAHQAVGIGKGRHRITPPEMTKAISYDELARRAAGWKLHLNFDASDIGSRQKVGNLLTAMQELGEITTFKIGNNGGQSGKEATVYVGHRDKAGVVANVLVEGLADTLIPPEGDALVDDTSFEGPIMGRFEVTNADPDFHQYGRQGSPVLNDDMAQAVMMRDNPEAFDTFMSEASLRADALLRERYGPYFTGSSMSV